MIPFWLFSILWAIISYLLASMIQRQMIVSGDEIDFPEIEEQVLPARNARTWEDVIETPEPIAEPVSRSMGLNKTRNGFYVLNTDTFAKNRVPMYVYYGDSPPAGFNRSSDS